MNSAYRVDELVPHAGKMSLLDRIVDYGDGWLRAEVDIRPESMFAEEQGVPAWIGLEYMAQTIAAYSGLQERLDGGRPKIGFLLGSRKYACSAGYFPAGQTLSIRVVLEVDADNGLSAFRCELSGEAITAQATVNVFQPDDAEAFLQEADK